MSQWNKIASSLDPLTERILDSLGGLKRVTQTTGLQVVNSKADGVVLTFPLDMNTDFPNQVEITLSGKGYDLSFFAFRGGRTKKVSEVKNVPLSMIKKVIENKTDLYLTI